MSMQATVEAVKRFLTRHPAEAFRPVPLAKAIGEKDIRRVRAALKHLEDDGDVVTCTVYVGDEPADKEFRIVAGGRMTKTAPSRSTILDAIPVFPRVQPVIAPVPVADKPAVQASAKPQFGLRGRPGARQRSITNAIDSIGRPMTGRDIFEHLLAEEPELSNNAIWPAIGDMKASGRLLVHSASRPMTYVTPALAERLALDSNTKGSDGETTPPEHAATGEAGEAPAAPREATAQAPQKTVQIAPGALAIDAQGLIESFFIGCGESNWYGLSWLVRMAGGDVPDTLEALAQLQRAGKLRYAEADRAPVWSPVEGRW